MRTTNMRIERVTLESRRDTALSALIPLAFIADCCPQASPDSESLTPTWLFALRAKCQRNSMNRID